MTREEAILVLEEWIERDKKTTYADRLENIEIYNMAIGALKVQELVCNNCHYWNGDLKYCMHFSTFMDSDDYCSDHIKRYEGIGGDEE